MAGKTPNRPEEGIIVPMSPLADAIDNIGSNGEGISGGVTQSKGEGVTAQVEASKNLGKNAAIGGGAQIAKKTGWSWFAGLKWKW